MKPELKLTPDEHELRYGTEPVGPLLEKMGIKLPTDSEELEAFNRRMDQIFGLSGLEDGFMPVRYLLVCESLGIEYITSIGFKALLPEIPTTNPTPA